MAPNRHHKAANPPETMNITKEKIRNRRKKKVKHTLRATKQRFQPPICDTRCLCKMSFVTLNCFCLVVFLFQHKGRTFGNANALKATRMTSREREQMRVRARTESDSYACKATTVFPGVPSAPAKGSVGCLPMQAHWTLQGSAPPAGHGGEQQSGLSQTKTTYLLRRRPTRC